MEEIPTQFPSAVWITHDCDVNPETGEQNKEHVHYVIYFTNESYKSRITKSFQWYKDINRFVKPAKDLRDRIRYLLHLDNPDKYQYPVSYLCGNVEAYKKYVDAKKTEEEDVQKILLLLKYKTPNSITDLLQQVIDMGVYATYRRNSYVFNQILAEQIQIRRG